MDTHDALLPACLTQASQRNCPAQFTLFSTSACLPSLPSPAEVSFLHHGDGEEGLDSLDAQFFKWSSLIHGRMSFSTG